MRCRCSAARLCACHGEYSSFKPRRRGFCYSSSFFRRLKRRYAVDGRTVILEASRPVLAITYCCSYSVGGDRLRSQTEVDLLLIASLPVTVSLLLPGGDVSAVRSPRAITAITSPLLSPLCCLCCLLGLPCGAPPAACFGFPLPGASAVRLGSLLWDSCRCSFRAASLGQDVPLLTRTSSFCNLKAHATFATADVFVGCFDAHDTLSAWESCMEQKVGTRVSCYE